MAIVLPHGVLFRGAAAGCIRCAIIACNYLDAELGMPAGLFFSTGIPTVVLVFKCNRTNRDIFFIAASNNLAMRKNQNILRDRAIACIIAAYSKRVHVAKYAHMPALEAIVENEYNLNIPRYVELTEPAKPIDVVQVVADICETACCIACLSRALACDIAALVANKAVPAKQLAALCELFKKALRTQKRSCICVLRVFGRLGMPLLASSIVLANAWNSWHTYAR